MKNKELIEWLQQFGDNAEVYIDDDGICLWVNPPNTYYEVGGLTKEQEGTS